MFNKSPVVLAVVAAFILGSLYGCGRNEQVGPPIPDSEREVGKDAGTPIFLFGRGGGRGSVGEDDEQYQEYLLWKEWQEYQKYQEWLRTNQGDQPTESETQ